MSYNQLPERQWSHEKVERNNNNVAVKATNEDDALIGLNIYPDNGDESCNISFKKFRGEIKKNDMEKTEQIMTNGITITYNYKVSNNAADLVRDDSDISSVYINNKKGIIAYQNQKGNWWTRVN